MLHINGAVIVEGKYDKSRVKNIVDCPVIVTNGFGIFKDKETAQLIRTYAQTGVIVILTDSDSAGFRIRGHIKGLIPEDRIRNAYVPDVYGKERRKANPSAEGKLGVEGLSDVVIISALKACLQSGDVQCRGNVRRITKLDLFEDGFSGGRNSSRKRAELIEKLNLPQRLPPNSLLDALNSIIDYDEYKALAYEINALPDEE